MTEVLLQVSDHSPPASGTVPIILHHGILGFPNLRVGPLRVRYYGGIDRALIERGHPVVVTRVHPTAGIETRARQLKEIILRQLDVLGRDKVLVIGHSMGGLDARYMISRLGMARNVSALLTITAPHRGSPVADWCMRHLGQRLGGLHIARALGVNIDAMKDLTTESCRRFNQEVPDAPGVRYFSVSASRPWHRVPAFAMHAHKLVFDAEGENDGLVSVKSSTWGEHLGVWPADHWHTINRRLVIELREPTGDIVPYYLSALARMQSAGVEL
jgi:triacylglycerol lipase